MKFNITHSRIVTKSFIVPLNQREIKNIYIIKLNNFDFHVKLKTVRNDAFTSNNTRN